MTHRCDAFSPASACRDLPPRPRMAQPAFSLVELLVVIGIIALLVGILLPTVGSARTEARRSTVKQLLAAIDRGMEVFNTDFKQYPDSSKRVDPVRYSAGESPKTLNGAHWLARAMVGHDGNAIDFGARSLERVTAPVYDLSDFEGSGSYAQRRSVYIQKAAFAPDSQIGNSDGPTSGRIMLKDIFDFPIIYYRCNPRAEKPFAFSGTGTGAQGTMNDRTGKYSLMDNDAITGSYLVSGNNYSLLSNGWTLIGGNPRHGLGVFGDINNPKNLANAPAETRGRFFTDFLSDPSALNTVNASGSPTVKPVNETTFALISAGPDGIFGTPDDVTNFK